MASVCVAVAMCRFSATSRLGFICKCAMPVMVDVLALPLTCSTKLSWSEETWVAVLAAKVSAWTGAIDVADAVDLAAGDEPDDADVLADAQPATSIAAPIMTAGPVWRRARKRRAET